MFLCGMYVVLVNKKIFFMYGIVFYVVMRLCLFSSAGASVCSAFSMAAAAVLVVKLCVYLLVG